MSFFIDKEVPHSVASRSLVKRQWQTARRLDDDEDDSGADENDGSANNDQDIENTGNTFQIYWIFLSLHYCVSEMKAI